VTWSLVEDDAALDAALSALDGATEIAVDTEFMRRNTYYPQVALLQLCVDDHAWLIDPLKISTLDALRELMLNPACTKILHSCSEDLEVFRHWLAVVPEPLIDTQRAAALVGQAFGLGYRALVAELTGVELDKGETRSDWLKRPLSESQCHYAALDVTELVPAWALLRERAQQQGRMDWIVEEGREPARLLAERENGLYRRIKSASRLEPRQLEVLRRLCDWREQRARQVDKPRGWVVEDSALVAIAREMPANSDALSTLEVLPAAVLRRQGSALLECVSAADGVDAAQLPDAMPPSLSASQRNTVKYLRARVRRIAEELAVAPEILMSGADLELLLRDSEGATIVVPERWLGWRADTVIAPLRACLEEAA
jgi:ribonuclease D